MTLEKIKKILMDFNDFKEEDLKAETTFASLGLDSLDIVDLIMKIDEEFGTSIELNENLKTIGDIVNYIDNQKQ